ncbi:MAG: hypothetical protein OXK79_03695 [Chloroflexota bacterium]|nr:hypothetical protein [Chloroflexota bacterium]
MVPFTERTVSRVWGDALWIGGGAGTNLPFYPDDVRVTFLGPDPA